MEKSRKINDCFDWRADMTESWSIQCVVCGAWLCPGCSGVDEDMDGVFFWPEADCSKVSADDL